MATAIDTAPRIAWATAATEDVLWVAEHHGGEAGRRLVENMPFGAGQSMGELEARLALGALATAQRVILERLEGK
jgi:hypothetical protein